MRPGSIKRVKLLNFMCHSELAVDFGTQVSFVTGHNGSGKSAILAGIVAGLGARANVTSRGGKISDLIKHGERSATVTIHLHNKGSEPVPYRPDLYGSTIQIERTFHTDKTGSYTLKSATGKVVSKKRQDLDHILNHFEIQVNNPVFLMNQDTCRGFLNSKTEKELYSFFYKAPLLDDMEEMVKSTRLQTEESLIVVQQKEEEMKPINAAIDAWRVKQERCIRPETLQKDIDKLKTDIAIQECHGLKKTLDAAKTAAADAELQMAEYERHLARSEEKIPVLRQRLQEERTREQNLRPAMEESQKALEDSTPEMTRIREETQNAKRKMADCAGELSEKKRNLISLETQLETARNQQDLREYDQKRIQLEAQMEEAHTLIQECRINRGAAETEKRRLEEELQNFKRQLEPINHSWQAVQRVIDELDREIRQYQGSQGENTSAVARLGQDAVTKKQIIEDLVQRNALRGQVIGPCVDQLSLKEELYGAAVERAVGAWFRTYLLEDERDRQVILDEFKRRNVHPPQLDCALGSGNKFATTEIVFQDKCSAPFPTVADLLTFKHPYVHNVLVDACNLHQIIVMPTLEQARKHFRDDRPFLNCRHILDLTANQHSSDADGYQFLPGQNRNVRVLAANFDAQIDEKKQERNDKAAVRDAKNEDKARLEGQIKALQQQISTKARDLIKFQDLETKTQNKFNNIKNELESIKTSQPTDIQVLLDEVDELKLVVHHLEEQYAELADVQTRAKAKEARADQRFKTMKGQAEEEMKEQAQILEDIDKIEQSIEVKEAEIRGSRKTIAAHEKTVAARKAEVETAKTVFENAKDALLAAGVLMERLKVRVKQTRVELDEMIHKLQTQLRLITADYENSWEFCQEKLDELVDSKTHIESQIVSAKKVVELMGQNAVKRAQNFETARAKASGVLCELFTAQMAVRGYEGRIDLDHEAKTLSFDVNPHPNAQQENSSVKSLSGGERSFTMVCFLVALWELIEIPFRVLDEFDVFMDMINRDFAMTRLVQAAIEADRQFIFLTPLHFSQSILDEFKKSSSVEVIRMPTARHKQAAEAAV